VIKWSEKMIETNKNWNLYLFYSFYLMQDMSEILVH